jgi:hypothetical protein
MYIHKLTYYFMSAAMGILLMAGMTSCANEDVPTDTTEVKQGDVMVDITIDTGMRADTRHVSSDEAVEKGTGYENYINVDDLHILFYVKNTSTYSSFLFEFTPSYKFESSDGVYTVKGTLTSDQYNTLKDQSFNYKVIVMANWGPNSSSFPKSNDGFLCWNDYAQFSYNYSTDSEGNSTYFTPSKETPIPMFGIHTYTGVSFTQGKSTHLDTIDMLRAMAKIEVKLGGKKEVPLTDVKLATCYDKGMPAPSYMYDKTITDPTSYYINLLGCHFKNNTTAGTISDVPFKKIAENDYVLYLPEYLNSTTNVKMDNGYASPVESYIKLKFNGLDKKIKFRTYNDDGEPNDETPFDIVRNHIYRYTVEPASTKISIKYVVEPWTEQTAGDITFD